MLQPVWVLKQAYLSSYLDNFFRGIPEELEEAAYLDGANPFQVFTKIMLPNARGAMVLTAILTFVWQWNDSYFTANFVTSINDDFSTLTTKNDVH